MPLAGNHGEMLQFPSADLPDITFAREIERKKSEPEDKLLKIAYKLPISLSAFFGFKVHTAVTKLSNKQQTAENRFLKKQNL